jgi:hypothetical protein
MLRNEQGEVSGERSEGDQPAPLTSYLRPLTVSSDDARDRPPATGVDGLERLAPVYDLEREHQAGQLARTQ